MRKMLCLLAVVLLYAITASAQTRPISGKVTDDKGEPVPYASVVIKGTNTGVAADAAGMFKINAKTGDVLVITSTGFATKEVTVGTTSTLSISVTRESNSIGEVIVTTSLGLQSKTKALGYSIAQVKSAELTAGKSTNLQNGLTGKVSGLNVLTTNNSVFADTRITLRGIRSLTGNNQPMLILDGTPLSLSYISSINPNDIERVDVLKSASSTAIYGPDGVNGAIVITTKKGSKAKPTITFSNTTQIETISYLPKFQKTYGSGYDKDPITGNGTYTPYEQQSWGDAFDGSIRQLGEDGPGGIKLMVPYSYNEKGRKNFFATGVTNQTDVSYSTGDFYMSAQNVTIKGVLEGDENNRRTVTLKSEKEYNKFKASFNVRYTQSQYNVTTNNRIVYYDVTSAPGQVDLSMFKDWKNDYFSSPDGYYTSYLDNNGKTPYFAKDNYRETGRNDDILANAQLDFKATSWLNFTYRVGTTLSSQDIHRTRGAFTHNPLITVTRSSPQVTNITASVTDGNTLNSRLTSEFFMNLSHRFGKFNVGGLLGHSYRETRRKAVTAGSNNLGTSELLSIVARKGEPTVGVGNSKTRLERLFGKINLEYDGWAFLEATGSYDKDSRLASPSGDFPTSQIAFFYPGVNASILLSEVIPAIKSSKTVSYLKIRGAISKSGNAGALDAYSLETLFDNATFFPYGATSGYLASLNYNSPRFDPEFVVNKEVGLEMSFFKNKIGVEASYYTQDNTNQIIGVQLGNPTGYTQATQNAAAFTNNGVEVDLKFTPLVKIKNISIDFKVNYAYQTSKITKIIEGVSELGIGNFNYAIVGQSAYVFKLTDYNRDAEGHVIVGADGMPTANPNLTMFGNTQPNHILGLNLGVTWKDLTFSAVAEYRGGNQIVSDDLGGFMDDNGISERSAQNGRRAFVFPNSVYFDGTKYVTNTDRYTQVYGREFWNSELNTDVQTNYLSSGAFWKLREVSISYNIPKKFYKVNAIKGITVGVSGRNLLMFVPKSNQWTDPEFSSTGSTATLGNPTGANSGNAQGRNTANNLPPTRIFGASISVLF
jgi:TonB-linked SusC/RagA family outer membrane protein